MASSTFYARPTLLNSNYNSNYEPLKHEDQSLQYYFKEAFILMDDGFHPAPLLASLLDKYLSFYKSSGEFGKMVQQQALAKRIKLTLENFSSAEGLKQAIQIINEKGESIKPEDDLMWL